MESHKNANLLAIGSIGIVLILFAGTYYYYSSRLATTASEEPAAATDESVGAQVSSAVQTPADNLPETNPFEAETNPFTQYQNPFE